MEICVKNLFPYFIFFFLVFKHDFVTCIDFIRIAALNTANDDVTN